MSKKQHFLYTLKHFFFIERYIFSMLTYYAIGIFAHPLEMLHFYFSIKPNL